MSSWFHEQQLAAGFQSGMYLVQREFLVWSFVEDMNGGREVKRAVKVGDAKFVWRADPCLDAALQFGALQTPLQVLDHALLQVHGNDTPFGSHHACQRQGEEAQGAADIQHSHARLDIWTQ
jgi:hypothetical protein